MIRWYGPPSAAASTASASSDPPHSAKGRHGRHAPSRSHSTPPSCSIAPNPPRPSQRTSVRPGGEGHSWAASTVPPSSERCSQRNAGSSFLTLASASAARTGCAARRSASWARSSSRPATHSATAASALASCIGGLISF